MGVAAGVVVLLVAHVDRVEVGEEVIRIIFRPKGHFKRKENL